MKDEVMVKSHTTLGVRGAKITSNQQYISHFSKQRKKYKTQFLCVKHTN